ncbi:P1 family peptidase [Croceibacterium sp. TMG7-5b_MA50]|uniref:P1 family peptidase n=1 Tax=Croceibacterium sp. TMG7-5b_MA50 TaxID=3121290 RepID=UPI0032222011
MQSFNWNRRTVLAAGGGALSLMAAGALRAQGAAPASTGPRNLITDVAGLTVGQADDPRVRTGTTVILGDGLLQAAIDVRGGGPGTRESDVTDAHNLVHAVNAVTLSGGSSYGLAAADGVATELGARGIGYGGLARDGVPVSPIVTAAILYDLANGGDKAWGANPPYNDLGRRAFTSAGADFALGTAGAGYGAMAGGLKGGVGSASTLASGGFTVGAIVAVNSLGSVIAPGTRHFWASPFELGDEFGGLPPRALRAGPEEWGLTKLARARENTTIACVATDLALSATELKRVAIMAQDGLARAIRPVHSPFDGDVVFALATAKREAPADEMARHAVTMQVGAIAADTLARAVARGVFAATPPPGADVTCWRDLPA